MNRLFFVLLVTILISCEKDINFDLKESPNVLVVDAESHLYVTDAMLKTLNWTAENVQFKRLQ